MTNRATINPVWASSALSVVIDPEVDVSHPGGKGGPGKVAKGWEVETEPQQWENYILRLRDLRTLAIAENGKLPWDGGVTYKAGALTYLAGVQYVSMANGNLNNPPATSPTFWFVVKFKTAAEYAATVKDMQDKLSLHAKKGVNSHSDNITAIGGYTKQEIDANLKVVQDTTSAHKLQQNPHKDTAVLVGTVPVQGGEFTGVVNYRGGIVLGSKDLFSMIDEQRQNITTENAPDSYLFLEGAYSVGVTCELMVNKDFHVMYQSESAAMGVGIADYNSGGRWQRILTQVGSPEVDKLYNPSFVLPAPDLHFPMMTNLKALFVGTNTLVHSRPSTLGYTDRSNVAQTAAVNEAAFEVNGLKLSAGTSLQVSAPGLFGCRDGCISYTLNNVVVVKDVQFTNSDLTYYFGTSGNVKNFRVWSKRLTPRQKLNIPR